MKFIYFFIAVFFVKCVQSQIAYVVTENVKFNEIVITNYRTGDTLIRSSNRIGVIKANNFKYREVLELAIDDKKPSRITTGDMLNEIFISLDTVNNAIQISCNTSTYTTKYLAFVKNIELADRELDGIKDILNDMSIVIEEKVVDSLNDVLSARTKLNNEKYIDYFIENPDSYLAVDVLFLFLKFNVCPVEKLHLLFSKLDKRFQVYEEWRIAKSILQSKGNLNVGDYVGSLPLQNSIRQNFLLKSIITDSELYIVFWANWCKFCKMELEFIEQNKDEISFRKIKPIAINLDS